MSEELLESIRTLGASRAEIAASLMESAFAPKEELSPSALGMWFTRGSVPKIWRAAAMDRLGLLEVRTTVAPPSPSGEAAA